MKSKVGFQYIASVGKICELVNIRVSDFFSNIELMVESQRKASKIVSDKLSIPEQELFCIDGGAIAASEVMGCEIFHPEDDEPMVSDSVLNSIAEVEDFNVIPPENNPVVLRILEKAKKFYKITGIKYTVTFEGPFTTAGLVIGQNRLLIEIMENESLCEKLIAKITDAAIEWKRYHDKELGIVKSEITGLVDDSISNISPETFEKIVLPHILRWYKAFPSPKKAFHCCGNINHLLPYLGELDLDYYDLMGESADILKAKHYLKNTYISQLVDFRIIRDGGVERIRKHITNILEKGSNNSNYAIVIEGWKGISLSKSRMVRDMIYEWNGGEMIYPGKTVGT